jgi:hypothetical protein
MENIKVKMSDHGTWSKHLKLYIELFIQSGQKVSVHLMLYCNRQVHRDFLITLYNTIYNYILPKLYTFLRST